MNDDVPRACKDLTDALRLPVQTLPQPDETTCGPTCLHAVYRYWGDQEPLDTIIARMYRLERGGTFAVFLGCDALRKGYRAAIYTCNVTVFDPTWFVRGVDIAERLAKQRQVKFDERLQVATAGYLEFLQLGFERSREAGFANHLIKPVDIQTLMNAVSEACAV